MSRGLRRGNKEKAVILIPVVLPVDGLAVAKCGDALGSKAGGAELWGLVGRRKMWQYVRNLRKQMGIPGKGIITKEQNICAILG